MTLTLKNLPLSLHRALKKQARLHGRSLNREVLFYIQSFLNLEGSEPALNKSQSALSNNNLTSYHKKKRVKDLIKKAQKLRGKMTFQATTVEIQRFKEAGRA